MKKKILICICIIVLAVILGRIVTNNQKAEEEPLAVRNYVVYDNDGNLIYDSAKSNEITDIEKDVSIMGLVELHHNGFIYIFGGQHFGELGYEIEEYTTSHIDDTNQTCIDYFTLKEYDTSYIEEGDLIICTGDLTKKRSNTSDFKTKGSIVVLKSADYDQMKKDAITGNRTVEATITAGDIYKEEGYMYLKYDIEDDTNSDTAYHFPFIKKVNISDNTEIIGELQKGNKVTVEYKNLSEPLFELELKSIEVIN